MGGDPEHADHLEALLEKYPNLYFDTSATKWQVREVSAHRDAVRGLIVRHPRRFLWGSDLVTRHTLVREHYVSRYWCQRTLWESSWQGRSPIADPDYLAEPGGPTTPLLCGVDLPDEVLTQAYHGNARTFRLPEVVKSSAMSVRRMSGFAGQEAAAPIFQQGEPTRGGTQRCPGS